MRRPLLTTLGIILIALSVWAIASATRFQDGPALIVDVLIASALAAAAWLSLSSATR
ncbi:hypothetical protein [Streptomyces sp. NPDC005953]|uniref:hypothetical protein n=1 Tax=unclassified Streptomyces TaxID=2593676 RepID=UPI0033D95779